MTERESIELRDLKNSRFSYRDLQAADFSNADLRDSIFENCNLQNANFSNSDIRGCDFSHAVLIGANFEGAQAGVSEERCINLLFSSLGFFIFAGLGAIDGSIYHDESSPVQSVGAANLAVTFILVFIIFLLHYLYSSWINQNAESIVAGSILLLILIFIFLFSLRKARALLHSLSTTSFRHADLTNAKFNNAIVEHADFYGAKRDSHSSNS